MDYIEKSNLYNETLNKIQELLLETDSKLGYKDSLQILSTIVKDYDLYVASKLIEMNYDTNLNKLMLEDCTYSEGNDNAGFVSLKFLLKEVEGILNCDDSVSGEVKFQYFVRPETEEEMEENEHSNYVDWYTVDENIDIDKLNIQFEFE